MLRRLEWIKNNGIFKDYRWDSSLPELERINVIYGPNGSGKTSLAGAFDAVRDVSDGFQDLSLVIEEIGARRTTNCQDDAFFDRLFVFSDGYVQRSHRFHEGSPNIDAVLTLGERTTEAGEKIAELRAELVTKTAERDVAQSEVSAADRGLTAVHERVSRAVVSDLSRVTGYENRSRYNSGVVKSKYAGDRSGWQILDDAGLAAKKQFVASDNRETLDIGAFSLTPDGTLKTTAESLLSTTPVTIVLDTLQAHPEATSWVQAGQQLHEHLDICIYCNSRLSDARKQDIEKHFSDDLARLQHELDSLAGQFDSIDSDVDALNRRIPTRGLLFDDLRASYDAASQSVRDHAAVLKEWTLELRDRVRVKRANVLASVNSEVDDVPSIEGYALDNIRDSHNERVSRHTQLLQEAAKEVEAHHLKSGEGDVDSHTVDRSAADAKRATAITRIGVLENEIAALENVEGDPTPSAEVLTREVARLLGRSELKFQAQDGRYVVTRDGDPAVGLSVGERTAITLVHFLEAVAHFDQANGQPIVVIDDPVSSLDSNVFMGISTYIWNETVTKDHVAQLILLTHNFDLFRQWDVQIESMHRNGTMRRTHPASLYELKSRHVTNAGRTRRRPVLVGWPESTAVRKKVRSSYHHAFMSVAEAKRKLVESDSLENRLDAQLLFPNVMRRILESFLAFKRPDWVGDFTDAMRKAGQLLVDSDYEGDADALRQQLTRYSHAYSHNQTPETDETINPDEIKSAISSVFVFMNQLDPAHFRGLCIATDIDPAALLPEVPAAD